MCQKKLDAASVTREEREGNKKDYAFRRHFNEKPRIIPGWPVQQPIISWLKNRSLMSLKVSKKAKVSKILKMDFMHTQIVGITPHVLPVVEKGSLLRHACWQSSTADISRLPCPQPQCKTTGV